MPTLAVSGVIPPAPGPTAANRSSPIAAIAPVRGVSACATGIAGFWPMPARARSSTVRAIAAGTSQRGRVHSSATASAASGIQMNTEASGRTSTSRGVAKPHATRSASPTGYAPARASPATTGASAITTRSARPRRAVSSPHPASSAMLSSVTIASRVLWACANPGTWLATKKNGCTPSTTASETAPAAATATRSRVGRSSATTASISGSAPA